MDANRITPIKLGDVIEFNPSHTIKKGEVLKKISMDKLDVYTRRINGYEEAKFNGSGAKFKNGDILLARITPCLENGKTAQVSILDDNEVAFGSTEFIVMREKEGKTINDFIYYLSISPQFRKLAISSMIGTSGRKRVKEDVLKEAEFLLPPLDEQKKIAEILSSLDSKIEINNDINKNLHNYLEVLFKKWFIEFDFPTSEFNEYKSDGGSMEGSKLGMIPVGWEIGTFSDLALDISGGDWGKDSEQGNYTVKVDCIRGADIPEVSIGNRGNVPVRYILEKNKFKILKEDTMVIEISGGSPTQSTGRITYINKELLNRFENDLICTNFCRSIKIKEPYISEYFYLYWTLLYKSNVFFNHESGTTGIKNLDINSVLNRFPIIIPPKDILMEFSNIAKDILDKIQMNGNENYKLANLRDTLIPQFMTSEISVK